MESVSKVTLVQELTWPQTTVGVQFTRTVRVSPGCISPRLHTDWKPMFDWVPWSVPAEATMPADWSAAPSSAANRGAGDCAAAG